MLLISPNGTLYTLTFQQCSEPNTQAVRQPSHTLNSSMDVRLLLREHS